MFATIQGTPEIESMLKTIFSNKFQEFNILQCDVNGNIDVKIVKNNIDTYATINCRLSKDKDNINITNIHFKIDDNFEQILDIIALFNNKTSSLINESFLNSFKICNSNITNISLQFNKKHELFHVTTQGIVANSLSLKWAIMFYPEIEIDFNDSKDLKVIEYLYKISPDVMEYFMGRKLNILYDDDEDDNKQLLTKYREIDIKDLQDMIGMNKI